MSSYVEFALRQRAWSSSGGASSSKSSPETAASQTPISYAPLKADDGQAETDLSPKRLPIDHIKPCSFQPRRHFDEAALIELADSIREQGLIQPLVVRRRDDHWELIAGERRWRASQKAGLTDVPVVIREASDEEVLELALVENLQRENLNPIEEALGYQQLIDRFSLKQEAVASKVGKSRAAVANALRLLKLPDGARQMVKEGTLSVGHAKVLLGLGTPSLVASVSQKIVQGQLSVRQTEALVRELSSGIRNLQARQVPTPNRLASPRTYVAHLEQKIREAFHTKVRLKYQEGKGSLEIRFFSEEELESILSRIGISAD